MIDFPYIQEIAQQTSTRITMLVIDGLGGVPHPNTRKSELETANIPNLDDLARKSACGLTIPVAPGITPGSGPGHMALFGYDPVKYLVGRGVLEAMGIGIKLGAGQIAARGNLCTVDDRGRLSDRRAGRIPTIESSPLIKLLDGINIKGLSTSVRTVKDHRFVVVFSGKELGERVSDTDPMADGLEPLKVRSLSQSSDLTAKIANRFIEAAQEILGDRHQANMIMLRGFSSLPNIPKMGEKYHLRPSAIAAYPMYRGLASLVGMDVLSTGSTFDAELSTLEQYGTDFDFTFLHYKPADSAGEDGDFDAKVATLEELDVSIPRLLATNPDTLVVAGDHSTPSILGSHSWHSVPLLVYSKLTRGDGVERFSERACALGSIGNIPAYEVMMLAMAHAGKLTKFGP